ncbi:HDOD domain-containing protein [Geomonas sp. RF6]|uniref:HDOD domain-containing protein n=1 Tax=Geomonas sp. RF6 TaxID=2897342 RepID=UPI001E4E8B7C|nr:HDOD domain-containing protein [Geomonas sp. RF6]UFS72047.1 HDOD domain-containing protein [Geomonas sp. RF6]
MSNRSIVEVIKSYLAGDTISVPVFNAVAVRLQKELASPEFKMDMVHQLISADPGLASQVLRVANSAFYSGLTQVATVQDAVVRLGSREVANIAMLTTQQELYRCKTPAFKGVMQKLWLHSYCCAVGSKWLAGRSGLEEIAQEAFLAGLLHDIGKLFLLKVMEEISLKEDLGKALTPAIMREVLSSLHVEQGYQLMLKWHMPDIYCDVVRLHQADQWPQGNPLLAVVRLANLACRRLGIGIDSDPSLLLFTAAESHVLGLKDVVLAELEILLEDTLERAMPNPS